MTQATCTISQAAADLTKRARAVRGRQAVKRAFNLPAVGDWWSKLNPAVRGGAIGAGVGALGGLGLSAVADREEKHPLRSALTGALAGGAVGAGIPLMQQAAGKMTEEPPEKATFDNVQQRLSRYAKGTVGQGLERGVDVAASTLTDPKTLLPVAGLGAWEGQKGWRNFLASRPGFYNKLSDPESLVKGLEHFQTSAPEPVRASITNTLARGSDNYRQALLHAARKGTGGVPPELLAKLSPAEMGDVERFGQSRQFFGVSPENIGRKIMEPGVKQRVVNTMGEEAGKNWKKYVRTPGANPRSYIPGLEHESVSIGNASKVSGKAKALALLGGLLYAHTRPNTPSPEDASYFDSIKSNPETAWMLNPGAANH